MDGGSSSGGDFHSPASSESECCIAYVEVDARHKARSGRGAMSKMHGYDRQGCWYPSAAYLNTAPPPPPPRPEPSTSQASRAYAPAHQSIPCQPDMHSVPTWVYPSYAPGLYAFHSGYLDQSGHWHPTAMAVPVLVVPYQHGGAVAVQTYMQTHMPQQETWVEEGYGSDSDSGSSCDGALEDLECSYTTPNYKVDIDMEADSWANLSMFILQNVMSKIAEGDSKSVRLVCRHWRAVFDQNLEQLTPNMMMSKLIVLRFPNLRALHLTNCSNVRNRDLMLIAASGMQLHTLTLGDDAIKPWVTNKGLTHISDITSLTSLVLQDCNHVTNRGILALNKLSQLEALSLKGCKKLTNGGLQALQRNTALTSLNLAGCQRIADKGLLSLSDQLNLTSLTLGCTRVKDEGLAYLARMTSLRELHFEKEGLTDVGIETLSSLTNLQSLALRDCSHVSGDSLANLVPQLPNLLSLDLYKNFSIDDSQLSRCLDFLGSVTFLDLRGTFVTEGGVQELTRLTSLQKLCLAPSEGSADSWVEYMGAVSNLTQLTSLTINNCQLASFPLAKSLRLLKQLAVLDLSDEEKVEVCAKPPVNHAAMDVMATITSLTSIDLSRRPVHEDHLSVLAERLPKLHKLIIIGCPVLTSEVQALQRRFPELSIHRKPLPDVSCSSSDHGSSTG